MSLTFDFVTRK